MKPILIILAILGLALVLWGLLGLWAASMPEEGTPTEDWRLSGWLEAGLGISLIIIATLMRRRLKGQAQ